MGSKFCKDCGSKIPRKIPNTRKKTAKNRKRCYNCAPPNPRPKREYLCERRKRKEALVKMLGGHCVKCGYNKSIRALSFHHKNPKSKSFDISNNGGLMKEWEEVVAEARKCELLCLNCHAEVHE